MTKKKGRNVALPAAAKEKGQSMMAAAAQANTAFQTYVQGCKDALELEGDWNLNTRSWEFEPMPNGAKPAEGAD